MLVEVSLVEVTVRIVVTSTSIIVVERMTLVDVDEMMTVSVSNAVLASAVMVTYVFHSGSVGSRC